MRRQTPRWLVIGFVMILMVVCLAGGRAARSLFDSHESDIEAFYYEWLTSEPDSNPNLYQYYPENGVGVYQFDPPTIMASLDRGRTDVFTPLLVDPDTLDTEYPNVAWTQVDLLRVASALSQKVWNEPLDLKTWDVYFALLEGDCAANSYGFDEFELTYYKTIKAGWSMNYTARRIDLAVWEGVARWAGDGDFHVPFLFGWKNVPLTKFSIPAEQAVRAAEKSGGAAAQKIMTDKCSVILDVDENVNRNTEGDWLVSFHDYGTGTYLDVFVDPFSGKTQ